MMQPHREPHGERYGEPYVEPCSESFPTDPSGLYQATRPILVQLVDSDMMFSFTVARPEGAAR